MVAGNREPIRRALLSPVGKPMASHCQGQWSPLVVAERGGRTRWPNVYSPLRAGVTKRSAKVSGPVLLTVFACDHAQIF